MYMLYIYGFPIKKSKGGHNLGISGVGQIPAGRPEVLQSFDCQRQ